MRQIRPARRWKGKLTGAGGDELVFVSELAREVYGYPPRFGTAENPDPPNRENSGFTAFAYLYRRFGPPPVGSDDYKDLGRWILKTRDPEVYLTAYPSGSEAWLGFGYFITESLADLARKPRADYSERIESWYIENVPQGDATEEEYATAYWDEMYKFGDKKPIWSGKVECPESFVDPEIQARVVGALKHALLDLLRPTYVRDVRFNLFGRFDKTTGNKPSGREAPYSHLAGWGVPVREMERRIAEDRSRRTE